MECIAKSRYRLAHAPDTLRGIERGDRPPFPVEPELLRTFADVPVSTEIFRIWHGVRGKIQGERMPVCPPAPWTEIDEVPSIRFYGLLKTKNLCR